ncbi:hypothetical protein [Sphaerotilus sp.]|uniref:hypothetical protein n=1 Tax=Sphaerotilus sp. TaxID=2093942 RepID=UPI0034E208A9
MKHQRDGGQLVSFNSLPRDKVRLSNESWSEAMLCGPCEGILSKLETRCIASLRKTARKIEEHAEDGTLLHLYEFGILSRFLLSVLWRAAVSKQEPFAQVTLAPEVYEEIRSGLLNVHAPVTKLVHCQIQKIRDGSRRISPTKYEGIVIAPIAAFRGNAVIFTFIFAGYLVKYFIPYVLPKSRRQLGFLKPSHQLFMPTVKMKDIPELMQALAAGYGKAHTGMVTFEA